MNGKTAGTQPHRSSYKLRQALGCSSALPYWCRNNSITKCLDDYSIYTKAYSYPAKQIRELLEVHYPQADRIRLVMDNLNTHTISSLYETFTPDVALALSKRLEIHFTPKHGSWLNIAEIELSALSIQCLHRRIGSLEQLQKETTAWERVRNQDHKSVEWHFTTSQARGNLKHLYPKI